MSRLALLGGSPVIPRSLPPRRSVSGIERQALLDVADSDVLSGFYGSYGPEFMGGPKIRSLEAAWAERFGVREAVSVNSATSGLHAMIGAAGIGPGDEVIVPPTTMSATVMAPLVYGAIPVFADVEPETCCLDPLAVERLITDRTRAVIAVNLFGHPARLAQLKALADARGLLLIEDNSQAPLAAEDGRYAGCVGHMGVFSLNYHKHLHCGEGGMCVTNDAALALRLRLIRNHGENAVEALGLPDLTNLYGFNLRMTEMQAAVALAMLGRIDALVAERERTGLLFSQGTQGLAGLTPASVRPGCRHVFYVWAARYNGEAAGVSRRTFSLALQAEGVPVFEGYVQPLYMLPVFQRRMAMGREGFPFSLTGRTYPKGLCPVAEDLYENRLLGFETCAVDLDDALRRLCVEALVKVHDGLGGLADWEARHA